MTTRFVAPTVRILRLDVVKTNGHVAIKCDPVGSELHGLGSSINCLGRRVTSYTTRDPKEIEKLLAMVS